MVIPSIFPEELWLEIIKYCDYRSLNHTMPLTCRRLYDMLLTKNKNSLNSPPAPKSTSSTPTPPGSPSSPVYVLHQKLRTRFKIERMTVVTLSPGTFQDVLTLRRRTHKECFDEMDADKAAIAMLGAKDGWGQLDAEEDYEPAVIPGLSRLRLEFDGLNDDKARVLEENVSSPKSDANDYECIDKAITVRDVLTAEADFCIDALEGKEIGFALYKKNLGAYLKVEAAKTARLRISDSEAGAIQASTWSATGRQIPEDYEEKMMTYFEALRKTYLDPEERLFLAFNEWKNKRMMT